MLCSPASNPRPAPLTPKCLAYSRPCVLQVPGYPTWEIGGELYPGEKTIEQLEEISKLPPPPSQ
jgi:hypothetical protein